MDDVIKMDVNPPSCSQLSDIASQTALVLETNNLRGGEESDVFKSLKRVLQLLTSQTVSLESLAQIVITHDYLDEDCCQQLEEIVGRKIDFVQIEDTTGYYAAKNTGFSATDPNRCRWVVFADTDCLPDSAWLAELLSPFIDNDQLGVVAGRTSYCDSLSGIALTTLDFMYFPSPLGEGGTRNFYANNVVFRRELFAEYSYRQLNGVYRAHCQVLGLKLQEAGVSVHYAFNAHTVHRFPDTWGDVLKLRWLRGQDTYGLTPFLVSAYLPPYLQWLSKSGPIGPTCVLFSRLFFSLRALNKQNLPKQRGINRVIATALIVGFSLIDMAGGFVRGLGLRLPRTKKDADAEALSYHKPSC